MYLKWQKHFRKIQNRTLLNLIAHSHVHVYYCNMSLQSNLLMKYSVYVILYLVGTIIIISTIQGCGRGIDYDSCFQLSYAVCFK